MKITRRLTQKISCEFYDFKTEKELLAFFDKQHTKIDIVTHRKKKDILVSDIGHLKKVASIKQVNLWGDDSYYYYDKNWNCYTLCLIKNYF